MTDILKSKFLSDISGVEHGFGVGHCEIADFVAPDMRTFRTNQIHGNRVVRLEREDRGKKIEADAFITNEKGLVCHVRTADCVPILIADAKGRAIAAVHAGWRGTALNVATEALKEMTRAYGTDPAECVAAIGPCICGGCYEVGREVEDALVPLGVGESWRAGSNHVDLRLANAALLEKAGVLRSNIDIFKDCTRCDTRFASFRRDGGLERQVNFVAIL